MPNDSSSDPSRRQFLGAAAGTAATVATAGCLSSLVGSSSGMTQIEPEEPSEPREGSPGEFYYFLEEHDIEVDELLQDDNDLYLTYRSGAETVEESDEEIVIIYEIYKQALIQRGSEVEYLYSEIANPFDEQALGWGINSDWVHRYDSEEGNETEAVTDNESIADDIGNETVGNETVSDDQTGNETTGNESGADGIDMNQVTLWNNIMNSKVYKEDLEDGNDENETKPESNESGTGGDDSESEANDSNTE